jgi:hypothetical protein
MYISSLSGTITKLTKACDVVEYFLPNRVISPWLVEKTSKKQEGFKITNFINK